MSAAYPGLMIVLMIASRSSKRMNALFIALIVNHCRSRPVVAERLGQQRHLPAHRRPAHQPVVGVDGDPELQAAQQPDRVLGDRLRRAGLDVGRRAHLQRDALVADVLREPAEPPAGRDVVDDAHAVAEPVGAAPLDRLPDGRQPERLAGVDGEVEVLAAQVLERVQVPASAGSPASAPAMSKPTTPSSRYRTASSAISRERAACRIAVTSAPTRIECPAAAAIASPFAGSRPAPPRRPARGSARPRRAARAPSAPRRRRRRPRRGPRRTRAPRGQALRGLHDRDGVGERLQVALQRSRVGAVAEPLRRAPRRSWSAGRRSRSGSRARRSWPAAGRRRGGRAAAPWARSGSRRRRAVRAWSNRSDFVAGG